MPETVATITRTKNRPEFLRRAMLSVLGQTYPHWLHVIVNDGGDPTEVELVAAEFSKEYKGRLKIVHHAKSQGMQNASNAGIAASESTYIHIHDDDDTLHPRFYESVVGFLNKQGSESEYQGAISQTVRIDERINPFGLCEEVGRSPYMPLKAVALDRFGFENPFPPIAFVYRRAAHDTLGLFKQRYNVLGDWDYHFRFALNFEIGVLPDEYANYHWRASGSPTGFGNTVTDGVEEHERQLVRMFNDRLREDHREGRLNAGALLAGNRYALQTRAQSMFANQQLRGLRHQQHGLKQRLDKVEKLLKPNSKKTEAQAPAGNGSALYTPPYQVDVRPLPTAVLLKTASRRKVVSFDVFDTALLRTVERPLDVFDMVQARWAEKPGRENLPFARARVIAEKQARAASPTQEPTFDEIYASLRELLNLSEPDAAALQALELETEKQVLYPNPVMLELYRKIKSMGKRVVFISDMYLPAAVIGAWLRANGYDDDPIYLSCERGASKHNGELLDQFLAEEGVQGPEVLHFGDNFVSDIQRTQERSFKVSHWTPLQLPAGYYRTAPMPSAYNPHRNLQSISIGLAQKYLLEASVSAQPANYWQRLGYELLGPLYFFYLKWVTCKTREHGRSQLLFLARDGYYLSRAFDILDQVWNSGLQAHYVYSSRRLLNIAGIERFDEATMQLISTPNPRLRVRDFISRLDLDPAAYKKQVRRTGFASLDEIVATEYGDFVSPELRGQMHGLLHRLSGDILKQAAKERARLLAYLKTVPLDAETGMVVDVGWQASSVTKLQQLLHAEDPSAPALHGCYFGTWKAAQQAVDAGAVVHSYFHHLGDPAQGRANLIMRSVSVVESLFSAPHPTITGLKQTNGEWEPVYADGHDHEARPKWQEGLWQGAEQYLREIAAFSTLDSPDEGIELIECLLTRLLVSPSFEDSRFLGSLNHRESFGNVQAEPIVAPVPRWPKQNEAEALMRQASRSNWKEGFYARLSEKQLGQLQT